MKIFQLLEKLLQVEKNRKDLTEHNELDVKILDKQVFVSINCKLCRIHQLNNNEVLFLLTSAFYSLEYFTSTKVGEEELGKVLLFSAFSGYKNKQPLEKVFKELDKFL